MSHLIRFFGLTALAAFLFSLARRGGWSAIVDLETFVCRLAGALGAMLIGASPHEWKSAISFVRRGAQLDEVDRRSAARWSVLAQRSVLAAGVLTYCVGVIGLLSNLSSPAGMGWGVGRAMLSVVYSVAISEFLLAPFASAASDGLADAPAGGRFALLWAFSVVAMITVPVTVVLGAF